MAGFNVSDLTAKPLVKTIRPDGSIQASYPQVYVPEQRRGPAPRQPDPRKTGWSDTGRQGVQDDNHLKRLQVSYLELLRHKIALGVTPQEGLDAIVAEHCDRPEARDTFFFQDLLSLETGEGWPDEYGERRHGVCEWVERYHEADRLRMVGGALADRAAAMAQEPERIATWEAKREQDRIAAERERALGVGNPFNQIHFVGDEPMSFNEALNRLSRNSDDWPEWLTEEEAYDAWNSWRRWRDGRTYDGPTAAEQRADPKAWEDYEFRKAMDD